MAHDVFISYASSDKAVADAVCSQLESIHRIRCWIAPRDVTPGASWAESIIDALDESKIMVLIFSSNANASMQIEREVERAVHKGINIIPLRIENTIPTKTLEYFISAPHWLDAITVPLEQHIDKLAFSVKALLSKHGTAPAGDLVQPARAAAAAAVGVPAAPQAPVPLVRPVVVKPGTLPKARSDKKWLMPVAIVGAVVAAAIFIGIRLMSSPAPATESATSIPATSAALTPPANVSADVSSAPASVASPPSAPAARESAAPATASAPSETKPAAPKAADSPAAAAAVTDAAAVPKGANFFIDFKNNLSDGRLAVEIDDQPKWSQDLKNRRASTPVAGGLVLTKGLHKATVTLHDDQGKLKETRSINLGYFDPGSPRTLEIRLSRFKKDLELKSVPHQAAENVKNTDDSAKSPSKTPGAKPVSPPAKSSAPPGAKPVNATR